MNYTSNKINCKVCSSKLIPSNTYKTNKSVCKPCINARSTRYMKTRGVDYLLWSGAQSRAKRRGLEFNLKVSDIIIPALCPVFGVPLERAEGSHWDNSPTLDRIDSSKGYTTDNVVVISWKANRLKSDGTLSDFKALVAWLETVS